MPLKFNCPHCGEVVIVKYLNVGEEAKCRHCGERSVIPANCIATNEEPELKLSRIIQESSKLRYYYFSEENIFKKTFRELFIAIVFIAAFTVHEQAFRNIFYFIIGILMFIIAILLSSFADKYKPPLHIGIKQENIK